MISPLRYPGGKSDFAPTVHDIIAKCGYSGHPFIEPFAGSAAVSLSLLNSGIIPKATLVERDPLVYAFWHSLLKHTDELIERFIDLPITLTTWKSFRHFLAIDKPSSTNVVDLGLAGLFFNRTNFSGILNAGPIGGMQQSSDYAIDCRTNKDEIIIKMLSIASLSKKISVEFGDALDVLNRFKANKDVFFYIDPPYFVKGEALYRHHYRLGDHKALARCLSDSKAPWLLSYDNHHVIEFLYDDFHVQRVKFQYSVRSPKNHEELLISNFKIPFSPVVNGQARN